MSTALWVGGSILVGLLMLVLAWRLRRAARTVDRIIAEETRRTAERKIPPPE